MSRRFEVVEDAVAGYWVRDTYTNRPAVLVSSGGVLKGPAYFRTEAIAQETADRLESEHYIAKRMGGP